MRKTGGGPPTQEYTPAVELALCNNEGRSYKKLSGNSEEFYGSLNTFALLRDHVMMPTASSTGLPQMALLFSQRNNWPIGSAFLCIYLFGSRLLTLRFTLVRTDIN